MPFHARRSVRPSGTARDRIALLRPTADHRQLGRKRLPEPGLGLLRQPSLGKAQGHEPLHVVLREIEPAIVSPGA